MTYNIDIAWVLFFLAGVVGIFSFIKALVKHTLTRIYAWTCLAWAVAVAIGSLTVMFTSGQGETYSPGWSILKYFCLVVVIICVIAMIVLRRKGLQRPNAQNH